MCSVIDMGGGVLAHTCVPCEINSIEMPPQNICIYAYFMASFLPGSSFTILGCIYKPGDGKMVFIGVEVGISNCCFVTVQSWLDLFISFICRFFMKEK